MKRTDIARILNDNIGRRVERVALNSAFPNPAMILVYMQYGGICIDFNTAVTRIDGLDYYKSFQLALICDEDGSLYVLNSRRFCHPYYPSSGMIPIDRSGTVQVIANSLGVNYRTVKRWFRRAQHYSGFLPIILHVIK